VRGGKKLDSDGTFSRSSSSSSGSSSGGGGGGGEP